VFRENMAMMLSVIDAIRIVYVIVPEIKALAKKI
jgi:hypothetical protein